jgi:hypothetical protein
MSQPPQDPAGTAAASDGPTRDIRLPPVPDRTPPAVRPEGQSPAPTGVPAPDAPRAPVSREPRSTVGRSASVASASPLPVPEPPPPAPEPAEQQAPEPPIRRRTPRAEEPTDERPPPREQIGQRTVAVDNPGGRGGPLGGAAVPDPRGPGASGQPVPPPGPPPWGQLSLGSPPSVPVALPGTERGRRWPWVVLALVPIVVIVVSGLLLLWLLRGT